MEKYSKQGRAVAGALLPALLALLLLSPAVLASCGGGGVTVQEEQEDGVVLPPGMMEEELKGLDLGDLDSGLGEPASGGEVDEGGESAETDASKPSPSDVLAGARITVVDVTRNDSNKKVIAPNQREVAGDYLEVELTLENIGDELVDLSQYSFRLESPALEAEDYRSYYGEAGTFGRYVDEHVISAVLLDYADLSPVLYKLKVGEKLEGVFLFFDLNPLSTARNEGFKPGAGDTRLLIHKLRGSDSGEEVEISLAGFAV